MHDIICNDLNPPSRILLGPGPSNIHPRVKRGMVAPIVGHLDPYFFSIMENSMNMLRTLFRTTNRITFPISGTGSAGMEAAFCNFLEPGDVAIIGVNGLFGERMVDCALRCGAEVIQVTAEWGKIIEPDAIKAALKAQKRIKLVALVHGETSTGALQPLTEASQLAKEHEALFLVDAVTSLGGQEVAVDSWDIDICFSSTQKCIGCPPGLAPFSASEKAISKLESRTTKVQSFYLDLSLLTKYWTNSRFYHHTAPISMIYALHEALALIMEEGLEPRIERHLKHGSALQAGLQAMGISLHAQEDHRLSVLTSVRIPQGIDDLRVRQRLLNEFGIEIGAGVGTLKGHIWRIGLMGHSSSADNIFLLLNAFEKVLGEEGYLLDIGAGVTAATQNMTLKST